MTEEKIECLELESKQGEFIPKKVIKTKKDLN